MNKKKYRKRKRIFIKLKETRKIGKKKRNNPTRLDVAWSNLHKDDDLIEHVEEDGENEDENDNGQNPPKVQHVDICYCNVHHCPLGLQEIIDLTGDRELSPTRPPWCQDLDPSLAPKFQEMGLNIQDYFLFPAKGDGACGSYCVGLHCLKGDNFGPKIRKIINLKKIGSWDLFKKFFKFDPNWSMRVGHCDKKTFWDEDELMNFWLFNEDSAFMWSNDPDWLAAASDFNMTIKILNVNWPCSQVPRCQAKVHAKWKVFNPMPGVPQTYANTPDMLVLNTYNQHSDLIVRKDDILARLGPKAFLASGVTEEGEMEYLTERIRTTHQAARNHLAKQATMKALLAVGPKNKMLAPPKHQTTLYLKQSNENDFIELHLVSPTLQGLAKQIEEKWIISSSAIRNFYYRNSSKITAKMVEDIVNYYCHGRAFLMEVLAFDVCHHVSPFTSQTTVYDITLCEYVI